VPHLEIITTEHGGHCGFIDSMGHSTWIDRQAVELLSRNSDS
jgi:predicted alpha/beta-fold hydrolase